MHSKELQERLQIYPLLVTKEDKLDLKERKVKVSSLVRECSEFVNAEEVKKLCNKYDLDLMCENYTF